MSIRFAASRTAPRNRMRRIEVQAACLWPAANDNGARHPGETTLHAALRHFARHGLAAAHEARVQARTAQESGDEQSYRWWLEICRALDRRMARELDQRAISG